MLLYLHSNSLELSILLNTLNVTNGQTNKEVHEEDGHQDHEDKEKSC